jgi:hypothetical protein
VVDLTAHPVEIGVHDRAEQGDVDVGVGVTLSVVGPLAHRGDQAVAGGAESCHHL